MLSFPSRFCFFITLDDLSFMNESASLYNKILYNIKKLYILFYNGKLHKLLKRLFIPYLLKYIILMMDSMFEN